MTTNELRTILVNASDLLANNKELVTLEMIQNCRALVNTLRGKKDTQNDSDQLAIDLDKILDGIDNVLNIEEKLIGPAGDDIKNVLDKMVKRPIILTIIAKVIR